MTDRGLETTIDIERERWIRSFANLVEAGQYARADRVAALLFLSESARA